MTIHSTFSSRIRAGKSVMRATESDPPPPASPTTPPADPSPATKTSNQTHPQPHATKSPTTSKLSPHATPFFPTSTGRSRFQRWLDSPASTVGSSELLQKRAPGVVSYRDVVAGRVAAQATGEARDHGPKQQLAPPAQPPRIRLRSEVHRASDAAVDTEGCARWTVAVQHPRERRIPAGMADRCFNCLERGHHRAKCQEPTRCLRCGGPGHRSFECRCRRRTPEQPWHHGRPATSARRIQTPVAATGGQVTGEGPSVQPGTTRINRRKRGHRGGARRRRRARESEGHRQEEDSERRTDPTPSPPPSPRRREPVAPVDACYIERTFDTEQWEAEYEYRAVPRAFDPMCDEGTPKPMLAQITAETTQEQPDGTDSRLILATHIAGSDQSVPQLEIGLAH